MLPARILGRGVGHEQREQGQTEEHLSCHTICLGSFRVVYHARRNRTVRHTLSTCGSANFCSMASEVGVMDNPPTRAVRFARHLGCHALGRLNDFVQRDDRIVAGQRHVAQTSALLAAMTFFPRQGTSTRFATGSQISPSMFCSAIEAAATACVRVPLARVTSAAAAMLEQHHPPPGNRPLLPQMSSASR